MYFVSLAMTSKIEKKSKVWHYRGDKVIKLISAKVLDKRPLELIRPIFEHPGESIQIFIPGKDEESHLWRKAAKEHFAKQFGQYY